MTATLEIKTRSPSFRFLERGFSELDPTATSDQILELTRLISLLAQWAARINLTGHRSPIEMAGRLVLDAAALNSAVPELREARSLADLGSGAGFPGLPLAILNPHLDVYLVDSRLKRNHFQREVRRRLDLSRVSSILGRSDEVDSVACDFVVAQAMAQPEQAIELMRSWVKDGGGLLLPASETASRPNIAGNLEPIELRSYRVPLTGVERKLWFVRAGY